MTRKTIAISAAAVAIAAALVGTAIAREHGGRGGHMDPFGAKTVIRAEVQAHAAAMFVKHDANKDSAVSKDEYLAAHIAMFEKADANKDGKVTPAERQSAHAAMRAQLKAKRAAPGQQAPGTAPAPKAS